MAETQENGPDKREILFNLAWQVIIEELKENDSIEIGEFFRALERSLHKSGHDISLLTHLHDRRLWDSILLSRTELESILKEKGKDATHFLLEQAESLYSGPDFPWEYEKPKIGKSVYQACKPNPKGIREICAMVPRLRWKSRLKDDKIIFEGLLYSSPIIFHSPEDASWQADYMLGIALRPYDENSGTERMFKILGIGYGIKISKKRVQIHQYNVGQDTTERKDTVEYKVVMPEGTFVYTPDAENLCEIKEPKPKPGSLDFKIDSRCWVPEIRYQKLEI